MTIYGYARVSTDGHAREEKSVQNGHFSYLTPPGWSVRRLRCSRGVPEVIEKAPTLTIQASDNRDELFVVVDGVKIAMWGKSGSAHAGMWVPIEPGWSVVQIGNQIHVTYNTAPIH
jgi:hypothetical protein